MKSPFVTLTIALTLACGGVVAAQSKSRATTTPHEAPTHATAADSTNMTKDETDTLDELHAANLVEVEAGKLAQKHAASNDVKKYGQHLVMDHTKADKELTTLAKRNGVKLTGMNTEAKLHEIEALTGTDFDHAFLNMMVKDHARAIDVVKTEQARVQNQDLRMLLTKTLPVLQQHEQHAQLLNNERS